MCANGVDMLMEDVLMGDVLTVDRMTFIGLTHQTSICSMVSTGC